MKMNKRNLGISKFGSKITLATLALLLSQNIWAKDSSNQIDSDSELLSELSLEDLFEIDTDIASNTSRSIFEQPSIISVITRDAIISTGARDLIDVIRMVPGFGFAHDTAGINSWGFRGIWGHEGKIMLMIDGAPYNDPAWGNIQFGRHYPVDLIEKIEVIRGPGAAKFGNYAELAVVRVTTIGAKSDKSPEDAEAEFIGSIRSMEGEFGSAEISAAYSGSIGEAAYSALFHKKKSNRTVTEFKSSDKSVSSDQNNSPMDVFMFDTKLHMGGFTLSGLYEEYEFEHNESLYYQAPDPGTTIRQPYERIHVGLDYKTELSDSFSLNGSILYQDVMSHDMTVKSSDFFDFLGSHYRIETNRTIADFDILYVISENESLSFGAEYFKVEATSDSIGAYFYYAPVSSIEELGVTRREVTDSWFGGYKSYDFNQKSVFLQYENYNDVLNFTIGARYANHSAASKSVLVPRVGVSKKFGSWGLKAMYSEAFRTGDAEHLNLAAFNFGLSDDPLEPETLNASEIELHYRHSSGLYTVNFFEMKIENPILFNTDAVTDNFDEIVSKGVEASWNQKGDKIDQELTLSYYEGDQGSVPPQLAKNNKSYLGFPNTKLTYRMTYKYDNTFTITPSFIYEGEKYWRFDVSNPALDEKLEPAFLVNLTANYKANEELTISMSIHDLLNNGYSFPQAYGQVLYPGDSREISLKALYKF